MCAGGDDGVGETGGRGEFGRVDPFGGHAPAPPRRRVRRAVQLLGDDAALHAPRSRPRRSGGAHLAVEVFEEVAACAGRGRRAVGRPCRRRTGRSRWRGVSPWRRAGDVRRARVVVAAAYTISRGPPSVRRAISATWWETAWRSRSFAAEGVAGGGARRVASRAACASADGEGADAGAEQVEGVHGDAEAAVRSAEHVGRGDGHGVEGEGADGVRREHVEGGAAEAWRASRRARGRR